MTRENNWVPQGTKLGTNITLTVLLWSRGTFAPFSSFCSPACPASLCIRQKRVMLSSMDITLRMQFPSLKTQCWYPCFKLTLKSDCVGLAYGLISLVSQANSWSSYSELERKGSLDTNRLWKIAFIRRVWGTAEMIWDCHVRTAILYLVP